MSLTMDRMCGFVCAQSNTSQPPSIRWKLKNSAIILNKWQANSNTTPMIKQMTSVSPFFVTELDGSCVYVKYEWEGGESRVAQRTTQLPPLQSFQTSAGHLVASLPLVHSRPDLDLCSIPSKEIGWADPYRSFNLAFSKIKMLLGTWARRTVTPKMLWVQLGLSH